MFLSGYHGNKYFQDITIQIIIENGVYMWTGTFNVTINEHLSKLMWRDPFITETPYLHNRYPHLARNKNISNKKMSLNKFKTKKRNLNCFNM